MNKEQRIILFTGIILCILSLVMELNFHYIQFPGIEVPEGNPFCIGDNSIACRGERSIYPISTFLLVFGLILIFSSLLLSNRKKPKKEKKKRVRK